MQAGDGQGVAAAEAGAQRTFRGAVGSGISDSPEVSVGEAAWVAVGDGGPGQAGVTGDDSVPVAGGTVAGHWGRSLGLGWDRRGAAHDDVGGGGEAVHAR